MKSFLIAVFVLLFVGCANSHDYETDEIFKATFSAEDIVAVNLI